MAYTKKIVIRVTDDQKKYVDQHGGSDFVRNLIETHRNIPEKNLEQMIENAFTRLLPAINTQQQQQPIADVQVKLNNEAKTKRKAIFG